MKNIEIFSIYVTKILTELHSNFPIYVTLDHHEIIQKYLSTEYDETMKQLVIEKDLADIFMVSEDKNSELYKAAAEQSPQKAEIIREIEDKNEEDKKHQLQILDGTIEFLIAENFIRSSQNSYALTNKGFSSLSMSSNGDSSYAEVFSKIFNTTGEVAKEFTVQTAVSIATAFFMAVISS
jgi:hypothetical protein